MASANPQRVGPDTMRRIRDYAVEEPSFTIAFAAWELGLSTSAIGGAVAVLLDKGVIKEIEPRSGPYSAVYAYDPPTGDGTPVWQPGLKRRLFSELDDARIGELRPANAGAVVPHTRIRGSTGKPGEDQRRQARGVRMTRGKGK
jgi:hypothetical protein